MTVTHELPPLNVRRAHGYDRKATIQRQTESTLDQSLWFTVRTPQDINAQLYHVSAEFARIRRNLIEYGLSDNKPLDQRITELTKMPVEIAEADRLRARMADINRLYPQVAQRVIPAAETACFGSATGAELPGFLGRMARQAANTVALEIAWEETYDLPHFYGKHNPHSPLARLFKDGFVKFTAKQVVEGDNQPEEKLIIHAPLQERSETGLACITEGDRKIKYFHGWSQDCVGAKPFYTRVEGRKIFNIGKPGI